MTKQDSKMVRSRGSGRANTEIVSPLPPASPISPAAPLASHFNFKFGIQLDLDYLERGGGQPSVGATGALSCDVLEPSPDALDFVKVVLLGAPAVGKTSIIQQFVWNDFTPEYIPTERRQTFYPSVIINSRLYELKITDVPAIPYFPVDSHYEWTEFRHYGLRSATAYVLVYDLSNVDTFRYVRTLREQIHESRDMRNVPVLVVGNKKDLLGATGSVPILSSTTPAIAASAAPAPSDERRDIINLVKKHWKCGYVECSAKYNWRVVTVFKELMRAIDALECGATPSVYREPSAPADDVHEAMNGSRCDII